MKKKKAVARRAAAADAFPHDGPVSVPDAYEELGAFAFKAWVRLQAETPRALRRGRGHIARILGYSRRRSDEVLRELHLKGYVDFIRGGTPPGTPTEVLIRRRAVIEVNSQFARM